MWPAQRNACIGPKNRGVVGNGDEIKAQCQPLFVFAGKLQSRPVAAQRMRAGQKPALPRRCRRPAAISVTSRPRCHRTT